jgi:hypothetical protein
MLEPSIPRQKYPAMEMSIAELAPGGIDPLQGDRLRHRPMIDQNQRYASDPLWGLPLYDHRRRP